MQTHSNTQRKHKYSTTRHVHSTRQHRKHKEKQKPQRTDHICAAFPPVAERRQQGTHRFSCEQEKR